MKGKTPPSGRGSGGSILITCLILLSALSVYGAVLISVVYERSLMVQAELERMQALYLAEAALAKSLHEVKTLKDADGDGLGNIPETELGAGFIRAEHDPGSLAITGIGVVNEMRRRVRIQYRGL
jgi:Tfp pilus assembly protein PilX